MAARWILGLTLAVAVLLASHVSASPGPEQEPPEKEPPEKELPEKASVVFVPPVDASLEGSLRDALTAQLSGGRALPIFERFAGASGGLRDQVSEARSLAAAHGAFGVFWLDVQSEADWLLYLVEPEGERVLVRRIPADEGGVQAAVEAVAVITRDSSEALIDGQTIGMEAVSVAPARPAETDPAVSPPASSRRRRPPPPAAPDHRPISFGVSVQADSPFEEATWQAGGRLAPGYRFRSGLSFGVGYVLMRDLTVRAPQVVFSVARSPIDVGIGYAFLGGDWVPTVEVRGIAEIVTREVVSVEPPLVAAQPETRAGLFIAPRLGLEYRLLPSVAVHVAVGVDLALTDFSYASRVDGDERTLLTARGIRPAGQVGVAFRP